MGNLTTKGKAGGQINFSLIGLCISGLAGSSLFLLLGYWAAGAMAVENEDAGTYISRLGSVLKTPFSNHFNRYTPIVMVIAMVVFEFVFFLLLVCLRKSNADEGNRIKDKEGHGLTEDILCEGRESEGESAMLEDTDSDKISEEDRIPAGGQAVLSQEICLELIDNNYTMEQITAMAEIAGYMPDINAEVLIRMFDVSMSAEDICEYIAIFYN